MSAKISPETVSALSSTMLIPLWAKAVEQGRAQPLLRDDEAVRMLDKIDYDFSKFAKVKASQVGCCGRAKLLDDMTRHFIAEHPDAVVVQIGAGLDARYERLGRPRITTWYDLDLPEVIEVRRMLLPESDNHYLGASMFDEAWMNTVAAHGKPVLLVIEGVLMYFESEQIKAFFQELCARFDNATILFDMLAFSLVGRSRQHDSLRKVSKSVEFKWSLLDTKEMETWNPRIRLEKELYMSKYDRGRFPFFFRMLYKIPYFFRRYNQRVVRLRIT